MTHFLSMQCCWQKPRPTNMLSGSHPMYKNTAKANHKEHEKKDSSWDESFDATAAFLGPNLWDKTLPYDGDFKMEYMDLDEFLSENGIPLNSADGSNKHHHPNINAHHPQAQPPPPQETQQHLPALSTLEKVSPPTPQPPPPPPPPPPLPQTIPNIHVKTEPLKEQSPSLNQYCSQGGSNENGCPCKHHKFEVDLKFSPADLALATVPGQESFNPRDHSFSEEELKPQPMIKKSKKQYIPEDLKDDKYWARRRKNNMAAKRSRDARRVKENQIAMRASFLEKENTTLKKEVDHLRHENLALKEKLAKYEGH